MGHSWGTRMLGVPVLLPRLGPGTVTDQETTRGDHTMNEITQTHEQRIARTDAVLAEARRSVAYAGPAAAVTITLEAAGVSALLDMLLELPDGHTSGTARHAAYCKVFEAQEPTRRR